MEVGDFYYIDMSCNDETSWTLTLYNTFLRILVEGDASDDVIRLERVWW